MHRSALLSGLTVLMVSLCAMAGDLVDNPTYKSWAKFKPGTSITYSQNADVGGMKMTMEMTQTLTDLTADNATVEMSMNNSMMPGGAQKHSMKIPAKVAPEKASDPGKMPEGMKGEAKSLGQEKVKVGDTEYDCAVNQFTGEHQGMKTEGKTWMTDGIPGNLVKMEMKSAGGQGNMQSTMMLKSVTIK